MSSSTRSPPKVELHGDVKIIRFGLGQRRNVENMIERGLEGEMDRLGECHLLLDFTNVEYLTSVELGTLISLHKRLKTMGGRLTLFNLTAQVFEVFSVCRLHTFLSICRGREEGHKN